MYLLYHEKSLGILAFAFLRWSSCSRTSSNFSIDLHEWHNKEKEKLLFPRKLREETQHEQQPHPKNAKQKRGISYEDESHEWYQEKIINIILNLKRKEQTITELEHGGVRLVWSYVPMQSVRMSQENAKQQWPGETTNQKWVIVGPLTSLSGLENLCMSAANCTRWYNGVKLNKRCSNKCLLKEIPYRRHKYLEEIKHSVAATLEAAEACHLWISRKRLISKSRTW